MNHLDPLWLQSYCAIARTGAMARAAQQVHRTPSAVSMHLRQLEGALDVQLVQRTTRSLRLTAEGERFLPFAQELLDLQGAARAAVQPVRPQETWRIGISEYFMPQRLEALLALLEREAQGARLELVWASSEQLQRFWREGQADLVVITSAAPVSEAKLLLREPLVWVSAPNRVPAHGGRTALVLLGTECPVRQIALAALARAGRPHELRLSCSGSQAAAAAVRAGWGVGCLNASAVPADLLQLTRQDPRRWPSPGRLAFYGLARPALQPTLRQLAAWAA